MRECDRCGAVFVYADYEMSPLTDANNLLSFEHDFQKHKSLCLYEETEQLLQSAENIIRGRDE